MSRRCVEKNTAGSGNDFLVQFSFVKEISMKTVTVVEMQSRLCETLAHQDADLTQVTYQGTPVVAVLALDHYEAFQEALSTQITIHHEITRESLTQGQLLFHSYGKRLAPRLQGDERLIKIIELTRRKKLVGALLAWNDWQQIADQIQFEEESQKEDRLLHLTAARNHLLKLPEQFAREQQQGIFAPITVIKQGEPVMAIVPWGWFERVTSFLKTHLVPFTRMERDGTLLISSNERAYEEEQVQSSSELRSLSTLWSLFHQTASEIAVTVADLLKHDPVMFDDPSYAALEEQCTVVARQAQELLTQVAHLRHRETE
jgi:PHD/YefM family antitoxin component YafN of YafNO toxin-antitoxin module